MEKYNIVNYFSNCTPAHDDIAFCFCKLPVVSNTFDKSIVFLLHNLSNKNSQDFHHTPDSQCMTQIKDERTEIHENSLPQYFFQISYGKVS